MMRRASISGKFGKTPLLWGVVMLLLLMLTGWSVIGNQDELPGKRIAQDLLVPLRGQRHGDRADPAEPGRDARLLFEVRVEFLRVLRQPRHVAVGPQLPDQPRRQQKRHEDRRQRREHHQHKDGEPELPSKLFG